MTTNLVHIPDLVKAEQQLVKKCQKGDRSAFKQLYELHVKAMFNVSMRILNNRIEVDDVLQESFLAAFKNIGKFEGKAPFGGWLKRIVINNSIDAVKRRDRQVISLEEAGEVEEELQLEEGVTYEADKVAEALQELPDGFRVIVTLFLFEDYSHKMIAEKLNISEGTSKSQYHRGRKKLAELIQLKHSNHGR